MDTLERIRQAGKAVAIINEFAASPEIDKIALPDDIISDFIERIKNDLFEFSTFEQFDIYNLFNRAFMYVYGKGAEFAYFTRTGNTISRIDYDFDLAMQAKCGIEIPYHILFHIHRKSSAMLDMYQFMYEQTKGSIERIISEGLDFPKCMTTILSGAFFWGQFLCCRIELTDDDKLVVYTEKDDRPYDYDAYDQRYKEEDFRVINYKIGKFDDIKGQLGL